jgi:hypothetical protein
MVARLVRSPAMSSNLIVYLIAALTMVVCVTAAVGIPAVAVILVRYFRLKERELALEADYREKSEQQQVATDERVQRLEDTLASLDHDVRIRLGIGPSVTPLPAGEERSEPADVPGARRAT